VLSSIVPVLVHADIKYSPAFGNAAPIYFDALCPPGTYISRFSGFGSQVVNSIGFTCSDGTVSPLYGGGGGVPVNFPVCQSGYTFFSIVWGTVIGQIVPYCGATPAGAIGNGTGDGLFYSTSSTCPSGTTLVGIKGSYYSHLQTLQFVCQQVAAGTLCGTCFHAR